MKFESYIHNLARDMKMILNCKQRGNMVLHDYQKDMIILYCK